MRLHTVTVWRITFALSLMAADYTPARIGNPASDIRMVPTRMRPVLKSMKSPAYNPGAHTRMVQRRILTFSLVFDLFDPEVLCWQKC